MTGGTASAVKNHTTAMRGSGCGEEMGVMRYHHAAHLDQVTSMPLMTGGMGDWRHR